jgi:hypothetical protein
MTNVVDFKSRQSILVEDVTDTSEMKVEVDGTIIEDADEILVITNSVDGEITINTNMDTRDLIYMLELVKHELLRMSYED